MPAALEVPALALAGLAAVSLALAAWALWALRAARAQARRQQEELTAHSHDAQLKNMQVVTAKQELTLVRARLFEAEQLGPKLTLVSNDLSELRARQADFERNREELEAARSFKTNATQTLTELRAKLATHEARLVEVARELANARHLALMNAQSAQQAQDALAQQREAQLPKETALNAKVLHLEGRLSRMGLKPSSAPPDLGSAKDRSRTRALLSELALGMEGGAAAVVDRRGLAQLAKGNPQRVRELARLAATIGAPAQAAAMVLGAVPVAFGLSDSLSRRVLYSMGDGRLLGLGATGQLSLQTLRLAVERLGLEARPAGPWPTSRKVVVPDPFARLLSDWTQRWAALGVAFGSAQTLVGTTDALLEALPRLAQAMVPLWSRARRDGLPDDATLQLMLDDGRCAEVRVLDSVAVLVLAEQPLAPEALDELQASLRFHLSTPAGLSLRN
jgi:hypothetical protein